MTRPKGRPGRSSPEGRRRQAANPDPVQAAKSRRRVLLISCGLAALVAFVYWPAAHFDFTALDDADYVVNNSAVRDGLTWHSIAWAWTTVYVANWHPLTWMSHMLDVNFFGLWAGGHHITSVVLHGANSVLLFHVLHRMTRSTWRSAVVAALFAVHPLHVESVAWIAERKDVLSGFFWMATLWTYVSYVERPSAARYGSVALVFALGLAAKPMLVTLPFVLLLLDYWPLERLTPPRTRSVVLEKVPLALIAAASSIVTILAQRQGGALRAVDIFPLPLRIANAVESYVLYLSSTIWPAKLSVFYPFPAAVPAGVVAACAIAIVAISAAAIVFARRAPFLTVGWFWYLITLLPVIGLVQVGAQARADRYTYLPLVGIFIVISWGGRRALALLLSRVGAEPLKNNRTFGAISAALVVVLAIVSSVQLSAWRDGLSLWQHAVDVDPDNYRAQGALGLLLKDDPHKHDEAIAHLEEAVRLRPDLWQAHSALADLFLEQGRARDAVTHLTQVVGLFPASPSARTRLGEALDKDGRPSEALTQLQEAVRLAPRSEQSRFDLASTLASLGRTSDAVEQFAEVLRMNPGNQQARSAIDALRRPR